MECMRYFRALRSVAAAEVTVAEAQEEGNGIGRRCRKLGVMAEVPDVAKALANQLVAGWVDQVRKRRSARVVP